ncbi:MAG TPA: hypothetical protein VGE66_16055 [Chitinophagaceae bacterium]
MNSKPLTIKQRLTAPTPGFFRKIRNIGLVLGAIGGAILAAPVSLPATIITVAGYLATAGLVASAVSATAIEDAVPVTATPNTRKAPRKKMP